MTQEPPVPEVPQSIAPSVPDEGAPYQIEITHSPTFARLFAAIAAAQGAFPGPAETKGKGQVGGDRADGTRASGRTYSYSTLADVVEATRKPMSENGLAVMALPTSQSPDWATVTLLVGHSSGEWIAATYRMPAGRSAQNHGSALTYCHRYLIKAMLNIPSKADDDDGASAGTQRARQQQQPRGPVGSFDPDEHDRPQQQRRPAPASKPAQAAFEGPPEDGNDPGYNDFHARLTGAPAPAAGEDGPMTKDDWSTWQRRCIGQMGLTMADIVAAAGEPIMEWRRSRVFGILDMIESAAKPATIKGMSKSDREGIYMLVREQLSGGPDA